MLGTSNAAAQEQTIGGHVGVVTSLISRAQGDTTMMIEGLSLTVPMGVVFRKNTGLPIDVAVSPTLLKNGRVLFGVGVGTAHSIGHGLAGCMGMFVDVSNRAWGVAPALDRVLLHMDHGRLLIGDLMVPVGFYKDSQGGRYTSIGMGVHIGVAF
jgi:hypothetical protein